MVHCSIITIGDELLIGQTIDTNSAFIAQELNKIGVWVRRRVAVGDVYDEIWDALDEESERSEIIIITGGLGPTADDITKPLLCDYFGGKMVVNENVLRHIHYLFEHIYRRPGPILERNLKQAEVPDNCIVLHNERGSAPGMWFAPPATYKAPLNPPQGGTLKSQNLKADPLYLTGDLETYSLLKSFVAEHRKNSTEAEKILWEIVRGRKMAGYKFRRQHIINSYIADFVSLREKLIIEVDGLYHQLPKNKKTDRERTEDLNKLGFEVLRFTNEEVLHDTDNVINKIILRLKERSTELSETKVPLRGGFRGAGPVVISLPGVPTEMKGLMEKEVIPKLKEQFKMPVIIHQTLLAAGTGESIIAEHIKEWEENLPAYMKLAYLPHYGTVRLRITATGDDKNLLEEELEKQFAQLKELVKQWMVIDEDLTLPQAVAKLLKEKKQTAGTAESCTGGYIAQLLSRDPGSSSNYKGSVVSYDNAVKTGVLNVSQETLESKGAVSEETVTQMVKGALQQLKSDYIVATSGIMGPDGGSEQKPVGLVWIAVGNKDRIEAEKFNFRFDRYRNIEMTALAALNKLRKFILANS